MYGLRRFFHLRRHRETHPRPRLPSEVHKQGFVFQMAHGVAYIAVGYTPAWPPFSNSLGDPEQVPLPLPIMAH